MKRILSLLICLAVVISSVSVMGIAADSEHWAYNDVKELVNTGIVSGDQHGNLNLDNKITRAEFIKTVNKYFGFSEKSEENFIDVDKNAWYFDDLAIAKKAGYVKGDNNGNANPDSSITRAEVSVIIARLLNLEEVTDCEFTDKGEIPDWALGSIGALHKKGIINGYDDGTFKADNSITRAEAFVIVKRNEKPNKEENKEEVKEEKPTDKPASSGGGGGGGGGGGIYIPSGGSSGGSSSGSGSSGGGLEQTYKATLSYRKNDATLNTIEFVAENAQSYNIRIAGEGKQYNSALTLSSENGTYKTADYSSLVKDAIKTIGVNGFNADIYVEAVGISGYNNSDFVKMGTDFLKLDIPDVEGVTASLNDHTGEWTLSWNNVPDITEYKVALYKDENLETEYKKYEGITANSLTVPASELGNIGDGYYVTVSAKVETFYGICGSYQEIITNGFNSGFGTKESPYVITSANQFKTAFALGSTAPNTSETHYLLTGFDETAMVLTDYKPMLTDFNGTLIGGNIDSQGNITDKKQKIDFNGVVTGSIKGTDSILDEDGTTNYLGLIFHKTNGATIKNFEFYSTISGIKTPVNTKANINAYYGTLVGWASGTTIENVHNYADIDSEQYKATGGIVGAARDLTVITNCSNHGNITVSSGGTTKRYDVAGIVGSITGSTINNCFNYGDIYGKNNAGGIAGWISGSIERCGNYGDITTTSDDSYGFAGGIAGRSNGGEIKECFNAGNVTAATYAGGIYAHVPADKIAKVTNCYNLGKIEGATNEGLAIGTNSGEAMISGFYDIGNETLMSVAGVKGTLSVESAYSYGKTDLDQNDDIDKVSLVYLRNLISNDANFKSDVWGANEGYIYPGLLNTKITNGNSYINVKVSIADISYDINERKWFVTINPSGKGDADSYKAYIDGNETSIEKVTDTKYELTGILPEEESTVKVEAIANEIPFDESDEYSANFKLDKLTIADVKYDKDLSKWYITFTKTGKGIATSYKLFAGSEELAISEVTDTKYEIAIPPVGLATLTLKAYIGTELLDESSETTVDFTTSKVSIDNVSFDASEGAWVVSINPQNGATTYKVFVNGSEVASTEVSTNKFAIPSSVTGKGKVVVKAYKDGSLMEETEETEEIDFTFAGGLGTTDKPYVISTADQFKKAFGIGSTAYASTHFVLGADITLDSTYRPMATIFKGTLDGKKDENTCYKITLASQLTTSDKNGLYQGAIFHRIENATIQNIVIDGTVTSTGSIAWNACYGTLTGILYDSTVNNIETNVTVTAEMAYATAGIVGSTGGTTKNIVTNCRNYGSIKGVRAATGIIGDKFKTQMSNCYNYGTITGSKGYVAGIVGENKDNTVDTIKNCGNYGEITANGGVAGGIAGASRKPIEQCFNVGKITASTYAGGIIGEVASGKTGNITNCFNVGEISGGTASGTAIGNLVGTSTIKNYYDVANPYVSSPTGAKTGTLNVTNVYGYSDKDTIKDLESTFGSSWTKNAGYTYPDLTNNSIVLNNKNNVVLP